MVQRCCEKSVGECSIKFCHQMKNPANPKRDHAICVSYILVTTHLGWAGIALPSKGARCFQRTPKWLSQAEGAQAHG